MSTAALSGASWQTEDFDVPAYLEAIGLTGTPVPSSVAPDLDLLTELHDAHVRTLPFGNVDVLLGRHPGVEPRNVQQQLVVKGRGGYCFEHSQLFAAALEHHGYTFRRALGRVRGLDSPRTHMSVVVTLEGVDWLCDPGFGFSITRPIELRDGATQGEGDRQFRIERWGDHGDSVWALTRNGALEHVHDDLPVHPVDVTMGHHMTSKWPESKFRSNLMVMRHLDHGHVTLTQSTRTERHPGQPTASQEISVAEVVDGVRELGIRLGDDDAAALARKVSELRAAASD